MSQYDDIVSDYGSSTAQAIGAILQRGITLGESIASMARQIATALGESLWRALVLAKEAIIGAFRDALGAIGKQDANVAGWIWICSFENSCIACVMMHGTKHQPDEDMNSHVGCGCSQQFYSAADEPDVQSGEAWFNEQSASLQQDILGPTRYSAWKDGQLDLDSMFAVERDGRLMVKTLKELGLR